MAVYFRFVGKRLLMIDTHSHIYGPEFDEDRNEVEIMESVDYSETDFRVEMEGDNKYDNRENLEGYQQKEFDSASGDLVDAEDDDFEDDFDDSDSYDDDFDDIDE